MRLDPDLLVDVRNRLLTTGDVSEEAIAAALRDSGRVLDRAQVVGVVAALEAELTGLGPLEPLLSDPCVTDILVNGADDVWWDRGSGLERAGVEFSGEGSIRQLAVRLAARAGRRLDESAPYVDARLSDGQRLHAIIPPLSVRGTVISLRIPSRRRFSLADLVANGSLDERGADWLAAMVAHRAALLVTGGTGSGKTTVLGALIGAMPQRERVVVVEDTWELDPDHPHVVSLEARAPNIEGRGEVSMRTLVRQALRMRPDRLVVGEVRGAEVVDMLAAMNTGHEGSAATVHANSPTHAPERIAALGQAAGVERNAMLAQFRAGVSAVVHVGRQDSGQRVIAGVGIVTGGGPVPVEVRPALIRQGGCFRPGPGLAELASRIGGLP